MSECALCGFPETDHRCSCGQKVCDVNSCWNHKHLCCDQCAWERGLSDGQAGDDESIHVFEGDET